MMMKGLFNFFRILVNYESYIDITTKLMQYNNDGFLGSTLNSKLKSTSLSAPFFRIKIHR